MMTINLPGVGLSFIPGKEAIVSAREGMSFKKIVNFASREMLILGLVIS
jgi:hypothetical protein